MREFLLGIEKEWLAKHTDSIYPDFLFSGPVFFLQITVRSEMLYFLFFALHEEYKKERKKSIFFKIKENTPYIALSNPHLEVTVMPLTTYPYISEAVNYCRGLEAFTNVRRWI